MLPRRMLPHFLSAFAACGVTSVARADAWSVEPSVSSQLTWTSNAAFGETGPAGSDTILGVSPRLRLNLLGGRVRTAGTLSLDSVTYLNRTLPNKVAPTAELSSRIEAIERLFFVELGYRAAQTNQNPFGVRADAGSSANRVTTSQWSFSPLIEGAAGANTRYRLRSDNAWVRQIGGTDTAAAAGTGGAGGYFGRHAASIEQDPRPLGWRVEAERDYTRYDNATDPALGVTVARAVLNYEVGEDWSVGLRVGQERDDTAGSDTGPHSIHGVETRWQPTPRTTLTAFREQRFFGSGWDLSFNHRQPRLAWSVGLSRGLDTTPQALLDLPATNNVAGLIDAIFTTRYPDPVERARAVQDFMARQGLPGATQAPISLFSPRFSIATNRRASVSFIGARSSLTLSGYSTRTEDALQDGPLAAGGAATNNAQHGASLALSHRLNALVGLNVTADWSRIRALDAAAPDRTTQQGLRVQLSLQAGPMTNTFLGGRYRKIESTVTTEGREGSVYLGLDHRF